MNDPIERLADVLRSPARAVELRGETDAVDALMSAVSTHGGVPVNTTASAARFVARRRPWRVATFITAGVVGFGGVAAAGPGGFAEPIDADAVVAAIEDGQDAPPPPTVPQATPSATSEPQDTVPEETVPEETVPEETVPEETVPEETVPEETVPEETAGVEDGDEAPLADDPDTRFDETQCADGPHGKTVSSVARTDGRSARDVVDAAQSSCGKDGPDDDADEVDDSDDEREDDEVDDRDDDGDDRDDEDDDRDDDADDRDDEDDDRDDDADDRDDEDDDRDDDADDRGDEDRGDERGQGRAGKPAKPETSNAPDGDDARGRSGKKD